MKQFDHQAPTPAQGGYDSGYEEVARTFAHHLETGMEVGAGLCVYREGECVVDLWGGLADKATQRPWEADTRIAVFSVTKGFAAMALNLLADSGALEWDAPVAEYWPAFAKNGKAEITVATLLNHRAGLHYLSTPVTLSDFLDPDRRHIVVEALENDEPAWRPGENQGYHALTFGMYVNELFERVADEPMNAFLRRELFEPLESDVWLGAPPELDPLVATLYSPPTRQRVARMVRSAIFDRDSTEARIARRVLARNSDVRRAFSNPAAPGNDPRYYNSPKVRRANLAWASATASARGVARAYLPFAQRGGHGVRNFLSAQTLEPLYARQGWSEQDEVLQKPVGWSHGFLKEEPHLFSPNLESFGHAGMGGALGWCDPIEKLTIGYVHNYMDWRVRSPRAVALCRAIYESLGRS